MGKCHVNKVEAICSPRAVKMTMEEEQLLVMSKHVWLGRSAFVFHPCPLGVKISNNNDVSVNISSR